MLGPVVSHDVTRLHQRQKLILRHDLAERQITNQPNQEAPRG